MTYPSRSTRYELPYLFAGQAQKELFVNEALARIDAALNPAVAGEQADPPAAPGAGDCYIVGNGASGAWAGHEMELASWQNGAWLFQQPFPGLTVRDNSTGAWAVFDGQWQRATAPAAPAGGAVIDNEARAALAQIVEQLRALGIFS